MQGTNNESVSGEYVSNSKNADQVYRIWGAEDVKYSQNISLKPCKEAMDYTAWGNSAELMYEDVVCGDGVYNIKFSHCCWQNNRDLQYSMYCMGSKDLFGCVGLRHHQFCILNTQYTKEEYEALVPKIIEQMNQMPYTDKLGRVYRYGEFFPSELSPYEYNITAAQEYAPLTKDKATSQGYRWYDQPERNHEAQLKADELPDRISEVTPELAGKVIVCAHDRQCQDDCTGVFTIIPQELAFLLQQGLPLPRLCPNCRYYERFQYRRPMHLHQRQCQCAGAASSNDVYHNSATNHDSHAAGQPCPNRFETSFAPDRPEIVYCESCYQSEVV